MRELSPAWETDLAVLRLTGSRIEENADHLIIRSPDNPQFHWGNCLFVTDEQAVDDAKRWSDIFHDAFPAATWVAIGLVQMPADLAAWTDRDLRPELDDVLTTRTLPLQTVPGDAAVRQQRLRADRRDADRVAHLRIGRRTPSWAVR